MPEWSELKLQIVNLQLDLDGANNGKEFASIRANKLQAEVYLLQQQLSEAHRSATEEVAKAHKRGWEQCKRECAFIVQNYEHNPDRDGDFADQLDEVIASMEYKEGKDE